MRRFRHIESFTSDLTIQVNKAAYLRHHDISNSSRGESNNIAAFDSSRVRQSISFKNPKLAQMQGLHDFPWHTQSASSHEDC